MYTGASKEVTENTVVDIKDRKEKKFKQQLFSICHIITYSQVWLSVIKSCNFLKFWEFSGYDIPNNMITEYSIVLLLKITTNYLNTEYFLGYFIFIHYFTQFSTVSSQIQIFPRESTS